MTQINKKELLKYLRDFYVEKKRSMKKDKPIHNDFNAGYEMGLRHAAELVEMKI